MNKKILKGKNFSKLVYEEFNNMSELISTNDSRSSNFGYNREIHGRDFDFNSYEQAVNWVHNYNENIEIFKTKFKNVDINKNIEIVKTRNTIDVMGGQALVPNALMNIPKSMIRTDRVTKKSKIINVVVDSTYKYSTTKKEVVSAFSDALAYLAGLEKQGFRVRISLLYVFGSNKESVAHGCKVLLKDEKQPLDIKRMMFPLTNLGSFRLFGWDWYERLPEAKEISGYGTPLKYWSKDRYDEFMSNIGYLNSKAYLIDINSDLNDVFNDVK